jgi:GrpB-like predicted nucleotidyltransferase (UPF0157 family)
MADTIDNEKLRLAFDFLKSAYSFAAEAHVKCLALEDALKAFPELQAEYQKSLERQREQSADTQTAIDFEALEEGLGLQG